MDLLISKLIPPYHRGSNKAASLSLKRRHPGSVDVPHVYTADGFRFASHLVDALLRFCST